MKTILIIAGQTRLRQNENIIDTINYHNNHIKPNETILFLWDSEYQQYKNEIKNLNVQTITLNDNLPEINEQTLQLMIQQLNKQPNTTNEKELNQDNKSFLIRMIKQFYQFQHIYQNINSSSEIYIKTRYDLKYLSPFNIKPLFQFYNDNKPIISTPFGGDVFGIGLGDALIITNRKANDIYKSYYDTFTQHLIKELCPINSEFLIRYIFKNLNHAEIYRFNFFCTTQHMLENNQIYHGLEQYGELIGRDNLYLKDYFINPIV